MKALRTPRPPAIPPRRAADVQREPDTAQLDEDVTVTLTVRQWAALNQVLSTLGPREIGLALSRHRIDRGLFDVAAARVHRVVQDASEQ